MRPSPRTAARWMRVTCAGETDARDGEDDGEDDGEGDKLLTA